MGLINRDPTPPIVWPPPRDSVTIRQAVEYARRRDPTGHRLHLAFAVFYMSMLPFSTALSSISFALLFGYALLRLPNTWRCYPSLSRHPLLWVLLAFTAWHGVSCLWSIAPMQGLDEVRAARVVLTPLLIWPVLEHLVWLLVAALIGVVAQNGSQLLQYVHLLGDPAELKGRYRGLLHGQTAMWCLAAMSWHLSATLRGRGWKRWLSLGGLLLASIGLLATGNRGPWIAAAVVMPLAVLIIAMRRPEARRFALVLLALALVGSVASWPLVRRMVLPRVQTALHEVRAGLDDEVYWTSGGLRIGLWTWAIDAWRTAPIIGIGAGGYRQSVLDNADFQKACERQQAAAPNSERMDRDHAHNTYLQILCTTGLVGLVLFLVAIILLFRQVLLDPPDHLYADGTIFVLCGWLIAANFDGYTLNGHLYGLLMVIAAITLPHRLLGERTPPAGDEPGEP